MHLTTSPLGPLSLPTGVDTPTAAAAAAGASQPTPPARWSRWWTSPIARFEYGAGSRMPIWREASLPADRGLSGALRPSVTFAGSSREDAIAAAHLLAQGPVDVSFSFRNGRVRETSVNPAIAVLRDSRAGTYWLAPLRTTVKLGAEWVDAPHAVDGAAFEGQGAVLRRPTVLSATRDLVAVVGAATVVVPQRWTDAPDDSRLDG